MSANVYFYIQSRDFIVLNHGQEYKVEFYSKKSMKTLVFKSVIIFN